MPSLILIFTLFSLTSASPQVLSNGSFEEWPANCPVNTPPDSWNNFSSSLRPDQAGSCMGTVTSFQGSSHMNLVWYSVTQLEEGAMQVMTGLTAGELYSVKFYAINDQGLYSFGDPAKIEVYINNTVVLTTPVLINGGSWQPYTFTFTASQANALLAFRVRPGSSGVSGSVGIDDVTILLSIAVHEIETAGHSVTYPNPFTDELYISSNIPVGNISLYNILSQKVLQQSFTEAATVNTAELPKGIYLYELRSENGLISNGKLIKE